MKIKITIILLVLVLGVISIKYAKGQDFNDNRIITSFGHDKKPVQNHLPINKDKQSYEKIVTATAYNTTREQTQGNPCISASGANICGRTDTVACSRDIPLGSYILYDFRLYRCLDRLAIRFDHYLDINFDKDLVGAKNFGIKHNQKIRIYLTNNIK